MNSGSQNHFNIRRFNRWQQVRDSNSIANSNELLHVAPVTDWAYCFNTAPTYMHYFTQQMIQHST